jgi:hypothetical protein
MRYRVVFRERVSGRDGALENPVAFLQANRSDEIVRQAVFVLRNDPGVRSSTDPLADDEEFLRLGTQTWEYEVADGKDQEFKDALLNSGSIVEFTPIGGDRGN